ncbi:hypothetical protein BX616_005912 [Lobosporangium transversale]|nr:hypothetical protein BX616_005912 [Lobosporangium transversale]
MSPPSSVSYSPSSPPSLPSPTSKSMVYASKASSVYSPITTTVLSEEKMFSQCLSPDAQVPFSPNFSQPQSRSPSPATVSKGDRTLYVDISAAASSLSLLSTSSTPSWSWSSSTPTMASPNDHKTDMAMSEGLVPRSTRERKSSESSSLRLPARYNNVSGLKLRLPCGTHGCKLQFCTEQTLKAHERICRPNVTPPVFICEESDCKASYTSVEKFSRHLVTHMPEISPEEASKFPCIRPDCSKFLSTPKSLKDHLQIHRERDSNVKLPCPNKGCNKLFGTSRCLRTHELRCRQVQSGVRLPCPFEGCKSTFGSTDYVRRHVLDHEKGLVGKDFQCNYAFCKSILANPLTLQRHVQLHEEQSIGIEWRCLFVGCGKLYSGSKQLKDHQTRIHKDLDENHTFGCAYSTCKGRFKCQGSAYKHDCLYRKQCGFEGCKILIPNKKILEEHLWHHKTLMSNPPYPCFEEDCRKKFYSKTGILAHLVSHMVDANITARTTSETLTTEGSVDETKEMTTSATAATPTTTPSKTDTNNTTASGA